MSMDLTGKVAAITGAGSGIGLATAEASIQAGATVVLVDRDRGALDGIAAASGGRAIGQVADLLDARSRAAIVPSVVAKAGRIDVLHCDAGPYVGGDLVEVATGARSTPTGSGAARILGRLREDAEGGIAVPVFDRDL